MDLNNFQMSSQRIKSGKHACGMEKIILVLIVPL